MGFFGKEICPICGKEIGPLTKTRIKINESHLCGDCAPKIVESGKNLENKTNISKDELLEALALGEQKIKEKQEAKEKDLKENQERINLFNPTYKVGGYIWFDDEHKWFVVPQGTFSSKIDNCYVFNYDDILDFEVLEDGTSITKGGFGKSLIGGAIFGLAGAIAGGTSKKTKQICNKLQIKITTKNIDRPLIYIDLINTEFKKDGFVYKQASQNVQEILSKFQIIIDQLEQEKKIEKENANNNMSVADEIRKFKELLDMGAITQEEFDAKKKELLG